MCIRDSRWAVQVFFLAIVLSAALSLASETSLSGAGAAAAALVLAVFIGLGILFDIIGVAVTAADPRPFHSMAAHLSLIHISARSMRALSSTGAAPPAPT